MAHAKETSAGSVERNAYAFLRQLKIGKEAEVKLMICRSWDTYTAYDTYLSTDFIAFDEQGDVIQLTAKSNVAHHFIPRLKEGSVYLLNHFDVVRNKDEYRIMKDNKLLIQLTGSTFLRKQPARDEALFVRHPFSCVEMEDMELTSGKYVIDVVGRVLNVGEPQTQKSGAVILEFDLANERGRRMKTALWGTLGPSFVEKMPAANALYCIILTSVSVKKTFNGNLSLSSTSATQIINDIQIPTLAKFLEKMSGVDLPADVEDTYPVWQLPPPKEGTLSELIVMVRKGKKHISDDVFKCRVEITNIRLKNSWYYNTCSGLSHAFECFKFCVQCDVTDGTASTVVVLFDETAKELTNTTAARLLLDLDTETCNTVLPNALANILNTKQVILLKTISYFEHGPYESFNCVKVYPHEIAAENPPTEDSGDDLGPATINKALKLVSPSPSAAKAAKRTIEVPTPSKVAERVTRRKFVVTSDTEDEDGIAGDDKNPKTSVCTDAKREIAIMHFRGDWPITFLTESGCRLNTGYTATVCVGVARYVQHATYLG
ncbi:uncharacterized protein [Rutidosis leptorrhynchoides]|uniref:uncharacterized protein n=1 Tax=Rutidosis leptorrhynchoides TaxID=125765 RepID=UPI003A990EAA